MHFMNPPFACRRWNLEFIAVVLTWAVTWLLSATNGMQGLRRTLGSAPLNINEVHAVLQLLRYICQHKDPDLLQLLGRMHAADAVLVPAADSRLVPTSACVHTLTCPPHLLSRSSPLHAPAQLKGPHCSLLHPFSFLLSTMSKSDFECMMLYNPK